MPFSRSNPPLSMDEKYLKQLSPTARPVDLFSVYKGPAYPLAGTWFYDSAIDMSSLNLADIDPMSFDFKDLFMDPFGASTPINGLTMPAAEDTVSFSSDLDSDDQSWRNISQQLDLKTEQTEHQAPTDKLSTSTHITSTSPTTRWSSSPEIQPQVYLASMQPTTNTTNTQCPTSASTTTARKTRSLSQDSSHSFHSSHSSHSTSTSTSTSPPQTQTQDPQTRNNAKRAAHNIIERRYRTNMNTKFLALEQAIIARSGSGVHKSSSRGGAGSFKKSEVLTNALAYIERVQEENLALKEEVALLTGERGVA